ncbi:AfsR/SARP family transcriptional regulator [Catenuloplanes atrovinosus]|uniref:DNA-binding SARP family transcriptional activator n=1 Tax=Catenuloplanes atrovinosus TaxID=137266 RepID=A0AAE4CD78_9ACTN|nr:BTAD domain-containing putative transcriptional regulator [Catenuloplanes atrovinosus]MDR7280346.1 DNA-binding SARP family transcriptional activator [Catenuloplanes atrovinosus]
MWFGILGPLRVANGGVDAPVAAGRDRVVLAMLLLNSLHVVSIDQLVDALWDSSPPATARGQLQSSVSRIRRAFAEAGLPADLIVTDPAGYRLVADPEQVDVNVFDRRLAQARLAVEKEEWAEAREHFRAALSLWKGPALAGITSPAVRRAAAALDEQRLLAIEDTFDVELRLGLEREAISGLTGLVERHPLRERLRGQLMIALYRAGRQADALAVYRDAREVLATELGIEPGPALREVQRQILTGEVQASAPPAQRDVTLPVRALPRTVADFTGRADAVDRLVGAVEEAGFDGPVIQVIDGMAGSGKTTLAVHVANLVAPRYPDAQLFIDLHGHSLRRPLDASAALVTLLRQLGLPGDRIPVDMDDRVALWRSELAARRALVVLDNVASTAQIAPLLPASAGSLALITSRRRLLGLDAVRPESLPVLSESEAVDLLARIAGDRVRAEPEAAADVVRCCGYLPLAIRLAAARLAHRPRWRVADLARRLAGRSALPELAAEERTVASAFDLSYAHLPAVAQRVFRLLGLHPGERFDAYTTAALAGLPLDDAQDVLDDLVDWHLVEEPQAGRYRLHDLMREFASGLAARDPLPERHAAVGRLLDFYLHAADASTVGMEAHSSGDVRGWGPAQRPDLVEALPSKLRWLEDERAALIALADRAIGAGHAHYAWWLARAAWRFLYVNAYHDDLIVLHERGLAAARLAGDDAAVAQVLNYLASSYYRTGRYADAVTHLTESLRLRELLGDDRGTATTRGNLSAVQLMMGLLPEALANARASYAVWERLGDDRGRMLHLPKMGFVATLLGRYEEALHYHRRHLLLACERRDQHNVSVALGHIGAVRVRMGAADAAARCLTAALRRQRGIPYNEAEVLNDLGTARRLQGRLAEAERHHQEALRIMRTVGDRQGEALVGNDLAATLLAAGDETAAAEAYRRSLAISVQIGHRYEQARALAGLGDCLTRRDPDEARACRERAQMIFEEMGVAQINCEPAAGEGG